MSSPWQIKPMKSAKEDKCHSWVSIHLSLLPTISKVWSLHLVTKNGDSLMVMKDAAHSNLVRSLHPLQREEVRKTVRGMLQKVAEC